VLLLLTAAASLALAPVGMGFEMSYASPLHVGGGLCALVRLAAVDSIIRENAAPVK